MDARIANVPKTNDFRNGLGHNWMDATLHGASMRLG